MAIITYLDPTVETAGNGSIGSPFKTLKAALAPLGRAEGQVLRIRSGYAYGPDVLGDGIRGLNVSNVTIEPYGDGVEPMIDGTTYVTANSGGWTPEGPATGAGIGHIWSKQFGTGAQVQRVFAAASSGGILVSQRVMGEALRHAPNVNQPTLGITATTDSIASIQAHLNENDQWYGAGSALGYRLYMWTPSNLIDPAQYYQGLGIVQSGAGTLGFGTAFNFFNAQRCAVKNIAIRGASGWPIQIAVDDNLPILAEDFLFYQCKTDGSFRSKRVSVNTKSLAYQVGARRIEFRECYADSSTSAKEQEPNIAYDRLSAIDQDSINGRCDEVAFIDCVGKNALHAAAALGAWDAAGGKPIRSGYLRHTATSSPWMTYSRSLNISLCEDTCYTLQSKFTGFNVVAQLAGAARVIGNQWLGMRKAIRKPSTEAQTTDGWIAFTGYRNNLSLAGVGTDSLIDMRPDGMVFAHNSCDGCFGVPIEFSIFDPGTAAPSGTSVKPMANFQSGSVRLYNNLMLDTNPERAGKPSIATYESTGFSVAVQDIQNNAIYKGDGISPTAKWGQTIYPINSAPGVVGTITVNPVVDGDLRPLAGSPLIQSGKYVGAMRDISGKRFGLRPSIGAFEVTAPVRRQKRFG